MADLNVCRICLRKELKIYAYDISYLKSYYEEVLAIPIGRNDQLPRFFCYECATLLYKFHQFKERCHYTRKVLTDLLCKGPLNNDVIDLIDSNKLAYIQHGTLGILKTTKRVKTCILRCQNNENGPSENHVTAKHEVITVNPSDKEFSDDDNYDNDTNLNYSYSMDNVDPKSNEIVQEPKEELTKVDQDIFPDCKELIEPKNITVEEVKLLKPKAKAKSLKKLLIDKNNAEGNILRKISNGERNNLNKKNVQQNPPKDQSDKISEAKKYKFTKTKNYLKFLDSGLWKKSNLTEEEALEEFERKSQDPKYLSAVYKCTDCHKAFSKKNMMDRHMIQKHGEAAGSLLCRFCKIRFKMPHELRKHLMQHYNKYQCLRCNLVCNAVTNAMLHEQYHNGVTTKCPHCQREFKHLSTFYTHMRTHRSKHMCALCGESFVSQRGLRLHHKRVHVTGYTENKTNDAEKDTYCETCKIKFENREAYDKHLLNTDMHLGGFTEVTPVEKCDQQNDDNVEEWVSKVGKTVSVFRKRTLPILVESTSDGKGKPMTCQHCGQHFATQAECRKHHLQKHPRAPFHTPNSKFICEVCGVSVPPGSKTAHMNKHTQPKLYTCETCGRSLTSKILLKNHMVTHTGERNYACHVCGKRYTHSGSLYTHHKTVHLNKPYPKRNRRKKEEEESVVTTWQLYFDNST